MAFAFAYVVPIAFVILSPRMFSCGATPVDKLDPEVCQTPVCQESAQFLLGCMDSSVDPCDDFYRYACGGWSDKQSIPEGTDSYSPYAILVADVPEKVIELLKNDNNENHTKPVLDAVTLFQGCVDEESREARGLDPLKDVLNSFGGWPLINPQWSHAGYQWHTRVATLRRTLGIDAIIGVEVDIEWTESSRYVAHLIEPEFGLESQHLKNLTSPESDGNIIEAYREYIISVGKLLNPDISLTALANDAEEIIQFESDLAQANYSVGEFKTVTPWYQEMMDFILHKVVKGQPNKGIAISEVQKITKNKYFKWADFLNIVFQDFPKVTEETEIAAQSRYLSHAIKLANDTDPRIVANYIGWTIVRKVSPHATKDFRDIAFHFANREKNISKPEKLERTCVKDTVEVLGFAVGRLYVDKFIPEEAKHDVEELVEDIRSAYEVNFIHNEWIDPETKNKALEKLRSMISFVGYPEWIKDDNELSNYYQNVQGLKKDEYFTSWVKAKGAEQAKYLMKWNQPKHRATEFRNHITEVNAYYYLQFNALVLPAAIFNPPIYKYGGLPALNHAGIGSYVAHEIGHGFDDTGSIFDKEGNIVNWWSKETRAKFEEKVNCYQKQYSSFVEPITNMSLNGYNTIGDDIADNAGVRNAYMAYKLEVLQSEENEVIGRTRLPGLSATPEQLFFIGFAIESCEIQTKKSMQDTIENDRHSPEKYRVNVPLSNSKGFAEVFNCPLGSRMNPVSKCHMW